MTAGIRRPCGRADSLDQDNLRKSGMILQYAHEAVRALLQAYDDVTEARGEHQGSLAESEQDLLRAMLVLAAAGLDSMTKQLVRDTLPDLVEVDDRVQQGLETFVARRLRRDRDVSGGDAVKFLARLLVADSHQKQVIREYIDDLTGRSMQSPEEVMRAAYALGLDPGEMNINPDLLRSIFGIRNSIIHELDIDFNSPSCSRQPRTRDEMIEYTNALLATGESLLVAVAEKLESIE